MSYDSGLKDPELLDLAGEYMMGGEIPLATKRKRQIPNERRAKVAPETMAAAEQIVLSVHPTARTRSLDGRYNCMGMVFGTRRTWIESEDSLEPLNTVLYMILEDDEYTQIPIEKIDRGDIVVYRNGDIVTHVAIVVQVNGLITPDRTSDITVLSQWGRDGEYFHGINDVNRFLGRPAEYWTDRCKAS